MVSRSEKDLENSLVKKISGSPCDIIIETTDGNYQLCELIDPKSNFSIFQDTSAWLIHKGLMIDVIGGMTPDIVLRSCVSNENRIYIEVKNMAALNYGVADSQIIRYFLYLLATSKKNTGKPDLQRAVILAAPRAWFDKKKNKPPALFLSDRFPPMTLLEK